MQSGIPAREPSVSSRCPSSFDDLRLVLLDLIICTFRKKNTSRDIKNGNKKSVTGKQARGRAIRKDDKRRRTRRSEAGQGESSARLREIQEAKVARENLLMAKRVQAARSDGHVAKQYLSKKANDAVNRGRAWHKAAAAQNRKRLNDRVKAEAKIMKDRVEAIKGTDDRTKKAMRAWEKRDEREIRDEERRVEAEQRKLDATRAANRYREQHDLASCCSSLEAAAQLRETISSLSTKAQRLNASSSKNFRSVHMKEARKSRLLRKMQEGGPITFDAEEKHMAHGCPWLWRSEFSKLFAVTLQMTRLLAMKRGVAEGIK